MSDLERTRLYAITPDLPADAAEELVRAWIDAGVRLVQLRQKQMRRGELLDLARRLAPRVSLIVNDHADIAVMAGAAGVHVGPEDLSVEAVRRSVGDRLIVGASAQTPEEARAAVAAGASYIGSGPAFPTATKTSKDVIGPRGVAAVAAAVTVPVFAIGGITAQRVPEVRAAGLERVCAISALAGGAEPARALLEALS